MSLARFEAQQQAIANISLPMDVGAGLIGVIAQERARRVLMGENLNTSNEIQIDFDEYMLSCSQEIEADFNSSY